jgi:hypothetical protein
MDVTELEITTDDKLQQLRKAKSLIDTTVSEITTDDKVVQPWKADEPTDETVLGITTLPLTSGVIMQDPRTGSINKTLQQTPRTTAATHWLQIDHIPCNDLSDMRGMGWRRRGEQMVNESSQTNRA